MALLHHIVLIFYHIFVLRESFNSLINNFLKKTKYNLKRYGGRSFSAAAPFLWNSLPDHIRNCAYVAIFKSELKLIQIHNYFSDI